MIGAKQLFAKARARRRVALAKSCFAAAASPARSRQIQVRRAKPPGQASSHPLRRARPVCFVARLLANPVKQLWPCGAFAFSTNNAPREGTPLCFSLVFWSWRWPAFCVFLRRVALNFSANMVSDFVAHVLVQNVDHVRVRAVAHVFVPAAAHVFVPIVDRVLVQIAAHGVLPWLGAALMLATAGAGRCNN